MKSLIGLSSDWIENRYDAPAMSIPSVFLNGVLKAGGFPVVLSPIMKSQGIDHIFESLSGLIIIGGPDLNSSLWNQHPHPMVGAMKTERQEFDLYLTKTALDNNIPILGICLGIQVINIALGGTLHQDIPTIFKDSKVRHRKKTGSPLVSHTAHIDRDSLLYTIMGKEEVEINSSHHQSVADPAPGLRASARAPDGVIEAVESTNEKHIVGVQWHPEYLTDREEHLNLFRWVVNPQQF